MKKAGIYKILNTVNQKCYIGYSEDIGSRWNRHRYNLRRNNHHCIHLQRSWNEYGEKVFHWEIIEEMPRGLGKKEYEEIETKWILYYNSHKEDTGYNHCMPGNYHLKGIGDNITKQIDRPIVVINSRTGEVLNFNRPLDAKISLGIKKDNIITKCLAYWKNVLKRDINSKRSYLGYLFINLEDYNPDFNYIDFRKKRNTKC